ncbi:hypothetical protein M408DRAFT_24815 [Serendipita vermifera MAFF 305830]|uniref:F-box domain-containing protein n=1 Tax=Serendipita vermifera MAFF 305830 TaxID=933852 RepID=A0A0C2WL78_SERVB|nr:hypothetical protein M408DRAFT_24815 [Serendipita vermifera MAFF 305830]
MSIHLDQPSTINESQILSIKDEIKILEKDLSEATKVMKLAQLRVDELTRDLKSKKSLVAPIRKLNHDILSYIFLCAAETHAMTSLCISLVCRYWRIIIHNIPRAWRFLNARNKKPDICEMFFARSRQCELHVIGGQRWWGLLDVVARRLRCLTVPIFPSDIGNTIFFLLERLCISPSSKTRKDAGDLSFLIVSAFPALKHLDLRDAFRLRGISRKIPLLHSLNISVHDEQGWPEIISACASSLKSLVITIECLPDPLSAFNVHLPNLIYLKIDDRFGDEYDEFVQMFAPNLTTYLEEQTCTPPSVIYCDTLDLTKHARFSRMPSFEGPTQLGILQLKLPFEDHDLFLDGFARDNTIFPHLQVLEFHQDWMTHSEVAEIKRILESWDWAVFEYLIYPPSLVEEWTVYLPEGDPPACEENLPCTTWK